MVSYSTLRAFYRIPLIRKNKEAVRILRDIFYVLIALHREQRLQEFSRLRYLYFKMLNSFAQYGRVEAKDTLDQILNISWFSENRHNLYRLIASYNRVIRFMFGSENQFHFKSTQEQLTKDMDIFFHMHKSLMRFDEKDDDRVSQLLENKEVLDEIVENLHQNLGY